MSEDHFVRDMVKAIKEKFDKYWGECHLLMAIASVLDPRFKKWLIGMSYNILYTEDQAAKNIKEVEDALEDMYKDYLEMQNALIKEASINGIKTTKGSNWVSEHASNGSGWEEYEKYIKEVDLQKPQVSELKMYYDEGLYIMQGGMDSFNVLEWWNIHKLKFSVLSKMAIDVLAIPISTVASESTFSAWGRVIEPFRSCLAPETVQMLICGGDWIRKAGSFECL
ncbi:zinc finger BED domain-containing protein RICESLEEPER 2-like [Rutidosis leptorrhynchoides]|uniref:zinc finger BED domain-containing protein RICESLEEPER 2-like n=1 Tax=Rutidosis leptorrhynchoides TaxID=125765 RepID=UPI003A999151